MMHSILITLLSLVLLSGCAVCVSKQAAWQPLETHIPGVRGEMCEAPTIAPTQMSK